MTVNQNPQTPSPMTPDAAASDSHFDFIVCGAGSGDADKCTASPLLSGSQELDRASLRHPRPDDLERLSTPVPRGKPWQKLGLVQFESAECGAIDAGTQVLRAEIHAINKPAEPATGWSPVSVESRA